MLAANDRAEAAEAECERLRGALEETAEALELEANRQMMPTESSDLKADADSRGIWGILQRASQALAGQPSAVAERHTADAWLVARETLPPDPGLNSPWSQAVAIMDEALDGQPIARAERVVEAAMDWYEARRGVEIIPDETGLYLNCEALAAARDGGGA